MATTILRRPMQTAAGHYFLQSFSFIVMTSSFFVYAFQSTNSLQRGSNIYSSSYRNRSSRSDTSVAYTSTPFDVDVDTNNDLWQLLQELRHNRNNAKNEAGEEADAFQRVIETLYNESRLNIHNLEQEIEVLRQKLDASPFTDDGSCNDNGRPDNGSSFSFQESFQPTTQEHDDGNRSNGFNYGSDRTNINVDEISNKLLKAVFVGYQWTEDDRKRLASAHPQDRPF